MATYICQTDSGKDLLPDGDKPINADLSSKLLCDIHLRAIPQEILMNYYLTHWGWVTHMCISKLFIIGSDNGLLPGRRQASPGLRQAIIYSNVGILLIGLQGTHLSEILIVIQTFSDDAF